MGQKRQIQEVEEPEFAPSRSRVRMSPVQCQSTPKDNYPSGQVSSLYIYKRLTHISYQTQPALSGSMSIHPSAPPIHIEDTTEEQADEMGDGDSQNSYKNSAVSSVIDFDPDDTMVSQQTAATDVTEPLQSRISQVSQLLSPAQS